MQLNIFLKIFPSFWTFSQQYYKNESTHLNSWHHSHKKQEDDLETQIVFVDIFTWNWNICFEVAVHTEYIKYIEYIQTAKNGSFCEELLSENGFDAVLVNFCSCDYGTNACEGVKKISTRTLELYANS